MTHAALLAAIVGTWKCTDVAGYVGDGIFTFADDGHGNFSDGSGVNSSFTYSIEGEMLTTVPDSGAGSERDALTFRDRDHLVIEPIFTGVLGEWTVLPSYERLECVRVRIKG